MDRLAVTRFNDQTWKENVMYRNSRQNNGCIYNSPRRISPLIYPDTVIFVIEMNNQKNQIEGIIKINRNSLDCKNQGRNKKEVCLMQILN